MNNSLKALVIAIIALILVANITTGVAQNPLGKNINTITTAVPFLLIAPDTRSGALGDAGVAISPDANTIHWNPAKLAFVEKKIGISISYTPWLRKLVPDINLSYLSFYKQIDDQSTFGASMRYFTLGDIQFTDMFGNETQQFRPNEFAFDVAYSRKFSERWGGGMALRYIYSNLTGGTLVQGAESRPGRAVAVDLSAYYENPDVKLGDKDAVFAFGTNISNIGNKMSYTETSKRDFIPINMRLGSRLTVDMDEYNSVALTMDLNKLLTPTPAIYMINDSTLQPVIDQDGNYIIIAGKDPDRPVASGIFSSFVDAPGELLYDDNGLPIIDPNTNQAEVKKGSKLREELRELTIGAGVEYWYDKQLALRAGYFTEHSTKGNRKFLTVGAGLKYKVFGLDFAYLIPVNFDPSMTQRSPLENTLRFTLKFDLDAFKSQEEEPIE